MTEDNPAPKHLIPFLKEYLEWAEAGAPPHKHFDCNVGLCYNYDAYPLWQSDYDGQNFYRWLPKFIGIRTGEDDDDGLEGFDSYPFFPEVDNMDYTKNPRRMEWVRKMIEEYGND